MISVLETLAGYAKLVVAGLPLACAKRLKFDCLADFKAVWEDINFWDDNYRTDIEFFRLATEALALFDPKLPQGDRRVREWDRRYNVYKKLYRKMVPLIPQGNNTPWVKTQQADKVHRAQWERKYEGWSLRIIRFPSQKRELSTSPAYYWVVADALGARSLDDSLHPDKTLAEAKEHLQSWVDKCPVLKARVKNAPKGNGR